MTVLSESAVEAARELQAVRLQSAQLKKREDDLKKIVYAELGLAVAGLLASGMPAVHVEVQHRRDVNKAKLEAMYPDVFESVMEEKEIRVLKVDL